MSNFNDVAEVMAAYDLPELPEVADDDDVWDGTAEDTTVELVLFRFQEENIVLGDGFTVADAQDYCGRDDTAGDGWFVGYQA